MNQENYRIISEKTYQELVDCATAIARHLDNSDGLERGVAKEFKDISEKAWNLDHDLRSGWHPDYLLPPKLPVGTIALVSEMASGNAPDAMTMAMAIKAYPGVVVAYPSSYSHAGYVVWSLVDAYAVTNQCEEYKDEWVLRRDGRDGGSHFWGFRVKYSELMKRKKELTIVGEN